MKNLTIYTAASGDYVNYLPLWEYAAKKAYPNCVVYYDIFANPRTKYYAACYRLLTEIHGTEFVYITDADIILLKENPTLYDFHTIQMKEDDLCYSNSPRTKEYVGEKRLTGLHFCNHEWYDKTREARLKYLLMLESCEIGNDRFHDELTLMKIAKESGLKIPPARKPLTARHHGIHIGTLRAYRNHSRGIRNQQLRMRISPQQAMRYLKYYDDPKFQSALQKACKASKTIKWELETLYAFCRRTEKEKE